jgi:hypothetical protein
MPITYKNKNKTKKKKKHLLKYITSTSTKSNITQVI